ncbi:MAG: sigma-70 family RNA polymerase sigma factor [Bacillota bacterium]|nr:sigma-70 family RNA polymerase sigma factor [Bacillota bacterium]
MEFDQLLKQFNPMIYKIMHSLHIYREVDEFYQVGMIALWDAWKWFQEDKGDFTNYAYSYIKGRMMNELNKASKQQERNVFPKEEYWKTIEDPYYEHPLEKELLLSYCTNLTDKEKKWVEYSCLHTLSIKEIAEKEKVSLSAVKLWRSGAKRKLRLLLKNT